MASYVYVAVVLYFSVSAAVSEECSRIYDSTDCVYDVYCVGVESLYQLGLSSRPIINYNGNQDGSSCKYTNFNYNGYTPMKLSYKYTERSDFTDEIPYFNNRDLFRFIVGFNLSNNEFSNAPTLNHMEKLIMLDISNNQLETAKLSNKYELPSLTSIDLSHNTINNIKVVTGELPYEKLININLSHNYLVSISDAIFDVFGELESLDISHNFIEVLTPLTFEGVKELLHLNIAYNRITDTDTALFRFNKLLTLNFESNKLHEVKRSDFERLSSLNILDLSSNSISSVDASAFDDMGLLNNLDMSNNQLKTIAKQTFSNLSNLKQINLSKNHFKALPRSMFKGKTISSFSIQENDLTGSLIRGTFEGLQYVTELDLSNQQLTSIEDVAFFGLEKVQKIYLNNNNLHSLSKNCFKTLQYLYELDLSQNKITSIDFNKDDLISLQSLLLRNNQITQVSYEYLHNLNSLQFLDLSYNNISHLHTDSFKSLKELINFEISNNPLSGALEENTFEGLNSLPSLDISRSMMTAICNNSFMSMVQLRDLNVSFSKIEDLQYNAFRKTGAIQTIDLSFNKLNIFNINITELSSLRTLLLNGNRLLTVGKDTLRELINLIKITLSNNNILNVDDDAFTDQKDLRYLDLSYNSHLSFNVSIIRTNKNLNSLYLLGIKSMTNFTHASNIPISTLDISNAKMQGIQALNLQKLSHLDTLVLNNNEIIKLKVEYFANVKTLRNLDVSFNKISFIQPGTFKDNSLLHSLNISHNALTTIGYGIFRGLIYLHTLDMSFNEINSLQSERFYEVVSLSVLIADHNRISTVRAEDFMGTSLSTLSIGENPMPCDVLVNLKKVDLPFEITAIRLEDKSDDENIDGITCNMNHGSRHSSLPTSSVNDLSNKILTDIRDILIKSNTSPEIKNTNTISPHGERKYNEDISSQLLNMTNRIENSLRNSTKRLESNMTNVTSEVIHGVNSTNTLLEKILKVLSANWRTIYTPIKENRSESLLPYIEGVRTNLESSMAAEKERLNEIKEKIAVLNTRIDSMRTLDAPKHEKYTSNEVKTQTESLFTKTCLALILTILVCFILYKFYKSRKFIRNRLSISTRELPGAMDHSTL